jgi:hypothetical protein
MVERRYHTDRPVEAVVGDEDLPQSRAELAALIREIVAEERRRR